jgi:mannitol-1-phosphate 5-dehydrogenase
LKPINNFGDFLTRKLYTYNSASCIIAYLGFLKGYKVYSDAANDGQILALLDKNYEQINKAMCLEFGYDEKDQKEFALLSRNKFTDKTIVDTVARNARDPQRKLGANERIIGPIKLHHKYGIDASVLEETAAAALLYDGENSPEDLLKNVCGLEVDDVIYKNIMAYVVKLNK